MAEWNNQMKQNRPNKLTQNQVLLSRKLDHPANGASEKYRMVFKQGKATFVFAENLSYSAIKVLELKIKNFLASCDSKLEGNFLKPIK